MKLHSKLIKKISMCMSLMLGLSLVGQQVFAEGSLNKNLQYYELDGKKYGFEQIVEENGDKIKTNVYLGNNLTELELLLLEVELIIKEPC